MFVMQQTSELKVVEKGGTVNNAIFPKVQYSPRIEEPPKIISLFKKWGSKTKLLQAPESGRFFLALHAYIKGVFGSG